MKKCAALTSKKKSCKNNALENSDFCGTHKPKMTLRSIGDVLFIFIGIGFFAFGFLLTSNYLLRLFKNITRFLNVVEFMSIFIIITGSFVILYGVKYVIIDYLPSWKRFNIFVAISLWLACLSVTFSIMLATSMIESKYTFDIDDDELKGLNQGILFGDIGCKSQKYFSPVKGDRLTCFVYFAPNGTDITNLSVQGVYLYIDTQNKIDPTNLSESRFVDLELGGKGIRYGDNKTIEYKSRGFYFDLPHTNTYDFGFFVNLTESYSTWGKSSLTNILDTNSGLDEVDNAYYRIISIITLLTSFSVLGIFVGMNNLKQMFQ